jgi:glycine hydroxymethyltransferase
MDKLKEQDREIYDLLCKELKRQSETIELIASENLVSEASLHAQGSVLTNKYAEGYPGKRYYGGCFAVDEVESIAIERAKKLFNAAFANVQPHAGAQANFTVFLSFLKPNDTIMGLDLSHGGHLTHGSATNVSGRWFNNIAYHVDREGFIQYDEIEKLAKEHKPKLIISGGSSYSRIWDWKKIGEIAHSVGAYHLADIAHYSGLIAAGVYPSPMEYADAVTTTTHKTLRGPRSGLILTNNPDIAKKIDSSVFPGSQGGPLMHIIAAKAVSLAEAMKPEFKEYQKQVLINAKKIAKVLSDSGLKIITGGTDSHMFLVDLRPINVKGNAAQEVLERAGITLNKNGIPYDTEKMTVTSGIRIGSPMTTSRGMKEPQMEKIAQGIINVLKNIGDENVIQKTRADMLALCREFPIYEGLEY